MKFTDKLWQSGLSIYLEMLKHPFNQELAAGILPLNKFSYYLQQDDLYIKEYTNALKNLIDKAPNDKFKNWIMSFAEDGYILEKELHDTFFRKYDIELSQTKNKACEEYTDHLLNITSSKDFRYGITALLPCFKLYYEVGNELFKNSVSNNPYQLWIDTYKDDVFKKQVEQMLTMVNYSADNFPNDKDELLKIYLQSCKLEFKFNEAAYNV